MLARWGGHGGPPLQLLFVFLQDLESAAAAICDILEEVELLLFATRPNDQPIEENPLFKLDIFNRAALNPMIAHAEHSLRYKHQIVIIDLQIAH